MRAKLVLVPEEFSNPFYFKEMGLAENSRQFLRSVVLDMFFEANARANAMGFSLIVFDGWRSVKLQEDLFWHYMKVYTVPNFSLSASFKHATTPKEISRVFKKLSPKVQEEAREANRMYVSWPSKDPDAPSPHATGGAIDVWLFQENEPCDLGVHFDSMEDKAGVFHHLGSGVKDFKNSKQIHDNRNILIYCMSSVGFSCYPYEIWHFNYGNQMDALVKRNGAIYSYIEP